MVEAQLSKTPSTRTRTRPRVSSDPCRPGAARHNSCDYGGSRGERQPRSLIVERLSGGGSAAAALRRIRKQWPAPLQAGSAERAAGIGHAGVQFAILLLARGRSEQAALCSLVRVRHAVCPAFSGAFGSARSPCRSSRLRERMKRTTGRSPGCTSRRGESARSSSYQGRTQTRLTANGQVPEDIRPGP